MDLKGIRKARKCAGLTQEELAAKVGLNRATISKYENGSVTPSLGQLSNIALALNTTVYEMVGSDWKGVNMDDIVGSNPLQDPLNDADIAFYGDYKELTEDDKETIRDMVRVMRERRAKQEKREEPDAE